MEVLRFQTNVPEEVALKFGDGKGVAGKYGDQVLFTLTDGRLMYLPPAVAERIRELGIVRGEVFQVVKREVAKDGKRFLEWEVTRLTRPADEPESVTAPVRQPAAQLPASNGTKLAVINGNAQGKAEEAALSSKMASATQLTDALKTAVAAAAAAEEFGKSIDYSVRFDGGHIYAMACTVLIGKQRENQAGYR